jgi:hypothetical protein
VQRCREQKHLIQIALAKSFAHAPILRTLPQLSRENQKALRKKTISFLCQA